MVNNSDRLIVDMQQAVRVHCSMGFPKNGTTIFNWRKFSIGENYPADIQEVHVPVPRVGSGQILDINHEQLMELSPWMLKLCKFRFFINSTYLCTVYHIFCKFMAVLRIRINMFFGLPNPDP
jgi:hypothetical protein